MMVTILVWHWATPGTIAVFVGPRQLDTSVRAGPNGAGELSVDLTGLKWPSSGFIELTLRVWGSVPETSPFYPALLVTDFRLV